MDKIIIIILESEEFTLAYWLPGLLLGAIMRYSLKCREDIKIYGYTFFLRDFIFKKTLFEKLQYLKQENILVCDVVIMMLVGASVE